MKLETQGDAQQMERGELDDELSEDEDLGDEAYGEDEDDR